MNSPEKRVFDLTLGGLLVPSALNIGAATIALIRLVDGPDVLYPHQRIGKGGKLFRARKLRTMPIGINSTITNVAQGDSYKNGVTELGKKLRPLAIDEIPQILNILRGEMTFVGPRAMTREGVKALRDNLSPTKFQEWQEVYLQCKPGGISSHGIAVRRESLTIPEWAHLKHELDLRDFESASFSHDSQLLVDAGKTAMDIVSGK